MEHTGASFPEAVRTLAASAGMTVPEENRSPDSKPKPRAARPRNPGTRRCWTPLRRST